MNKKTMIFTIIGTIAGIIFGLIGTSLLFCPYLCDKNQEDFIFTMKEQCREKGEKIYQEDIDKFEDYELCEPLYNYSSDWHSCIYYSCYKENGSIIQEWIKDTNTNKVITSGPKDFFWNLDYGALYLESGIIELSPGEFTFIDIEGIEKDIEEAERFEKLKEALFSQ